MKRPHFSPGPESSECQLYALDEIPFNSLAFSSMLVTLNLVWPVSSSKIRLISEETQSDVFYMSLHGIFLCVQYVEDVKAGRFKFHYGTINKR